MPDLDTLDTADDASNDTMQSADDTVPSELLQQLAEQLAELRARVVR